MEIISVIQDPTVIEKILVHLNLAKPPRGPPPSPRTVIYDEPASDFPDAVDGPFSDEF